MKTERDRNSSNMKTPDAKPDLRHKDRPGQRPRPRDANNKDRGNDDGSKMEKQGAEVELTPSGEKKFTGRCRLFVGNVTGETSEEEFKQMFSEYGELSEVYMNGPRGFGFVRLDTRQNAESAKNALDGKSHKGRILRVRFAAHGAALKVRYLPQHVTNELLEKAFTQFGDVERAVVITDDRGRSVGEGIVEFARKPGAQQAMNRINNGVFLMGVTPRPIVVEAMDQRDEEDGLQEKFLGKNQQIQKEREREPGFAEPGTFEFEYGQKWKDLYNMEKQRKETLKHEMDEAFQRLEMDMDNAEKEYQTVLLRQDLMRRQEELRRLEEEMARRREMDSRRYEDMRQQREVEERRRQEMVMRQQQEEIHRREVERTGMRGGRNDDELLMQQQAAIREMQDRDGPRGPRGGAPPMAPPPAPPAALGVDRQRQNRESMQGSEMGQGNMGMNNQQTMQRQSRFDQPPQAMYNQMGGQGGPGNSQGMGSGQGQQNMMGRGQNMGGNMGPGEHMAGRGNRERGNREDFYESKRPRRF